MGGGGVGGRSGGNIILYLTLHCHHQNDTCINMGRGDSHFNVSFTVRAKVIRQCLQTTTSEEKGKPKRGIEPSWSAYQPEALPLGQTFRL